MSASASAPDSGSLPCELDKCILSSEVLRLPIEILEQSGDAFGDEAEEVTEGLREAERFYRAYCQDCKLAGDERQRSVGLGLFLLAEKNLEDASSPIVEAFRTIRRERKRLEREARDKTRVDPDRLSAVLRAHEQLAHARPSTRPEPIRQVLDREQERLVVTLSRVLGDELNVASLLEALEGSIAGLDENIEPAPSSEVGFLESWERRLSAVGAVLRPDERAAITWVRQEQSALPADCSLGPDPDWNRSVRYVGEVGGEPRVVVEMVLETDLARASADDPSELVRSVVKTRREAAVRHGFHHVVGFVRNRPWPDSVEELADRLAPNDRLAAGATSVVFVDLRGERITVGGRGTVPKALEFLYSPRADQQFLDRVREAAQDPLDIEGYVEIDRLSRETQLPSPVVAWLLDRLPWEGQRTEIEGVGEVYRRSVFEG